MNKKVIESLIKCGAFDSFGATRRQLLDGLDGALRWAASHAKDDGNQIGLFASAGINVESPEPALPADARLVRQGDAQGRARGPRLLHHRPSAG